jgi:hypothetical protein
MECRSNRFAEEYEGPKGYRGKRATRSRGGKRVLYIRLLSLEFQPEHHTATLLVCCTFEVAAELSGAIEVTGLVHY